MDIIIGFIKQKEVIAGLSFIVIGIVVGVFKQYQFIAGLNTVSGMTKKELDKIDLDYVTKYFGLFFGVLGLLMVLSPFIYDFLGVKHEVRNGIFPFAIVSVCVFIILFFNVFKRKRVYKKDVHD